MQLCILGTGYVGLVTGACLAAVGHHVTCVDIDNEKIAALKNAQVPIYEPGLAEVISRAQKSDTLFFTTSLEEALGKGCEICVIAVGTPPDPYGGEDLSYVLEAAKDIGRFMQNDLVVAVKSTVSMGTSEKVRNVIREQLDLRHATLNFAMVSNPEFLREGSAVGDFMRPDRIIVGADDEAAVAPMRDLYEPFIRNGHPFLVMSIKSAELSKYAANTMLAARISFMNEVSHLCDATGADIMEVRKGIGSDKRIGMDFLYAGVGYGGSCFPKDVRAMSSLARKLGCSSQIFDAIDQVNVAQRLLAANRVIQYFKKNQGSAWNKRVALWGLAFKANTDDVRDSAPLISILRMIEEGIYITAYDPEAMPRTREALGNHERLSFASSMYEAAQNADALLVMTEWGVFLNPDFARLKSVMQQPVLFDARNLYRPSDALKEGFEYFCTGRGYIPTGTAH